MAVERHRHCTFDFLTWRQEKKGSLEFVIYEDGEDVGTGRWRELEFIVHPGGLWSQSAHNLEAQTVPGSYIFLKYA